MKFSVPAIQSRYYLSLLVALMTCLTLLISLSFKIIEIHGLIFTVNSLLCPFTAAIYLLVLGQCNMNEQRQILNQSLITLYIFSVGVYLLVNLPGIDSTRNGMAYQIVFEGIPRKFFSATLAFGLSFYLPHLLAASRFKNFINCPKQRLLLVLFTGSSFFTLDYILLFADPMAARFLQMFIDSLLITTFINLVIGIVYLLTLFKPVVVKKEQSTMRFFHTQPTYQYLAGFSVSVLLVCLACENRLVIIDNQWLLTSSGFLFPLVLMISNLVSELYGPRAAFFLNIVLTVCELFFVFMLMILILLPSPDFFNLNPFYSLVISPRIIVSTVSLLITLASNSYFLEKLKHSVYGLNRALRVIIANTIANSLLCLVNYCMLFGGLYSHEQIFDLVINGWVYKFGASIIILPVTLKLYNILQRRGKPVMLNAGLSS